MNDVNTCTAIENHRLKRYVSYYTIFTIELILKPSVICKRSMHELFSVMTTVKIAYNVGYTRYIKLSLWSGFRFILAYLFNLLTVILKGTRNLCIKGTGE